MRGASFLVAVTFAAEIGDVRRFDTPRRLMSFLGLAPAESSTGDTIRRKGLTLAGNRRARRALVEAAWTYRYPARVSATLRARLEGLPKPVRDIAWELAWLSPEWVVATSLCQSVGRYPPPHGISNAGADDCKKPDSDRSSCAPR